LKSLSDLGRAHNSFFILVSELLISRMAIAATDPILIILAAGNPSRGLDCSGNFPRCEVDVIRLMTCHQLASEPRGG
jgi:hypothetical protein